jgi:hypothetical protein
MFGKNKIQRQLDDLKREIDILKSVDFRLEIEKLKTHVYSLRGLINRRFPSEEKEEKQEKENNKNSVIIPM